ncbi:hypothetical protein DM02DRAFT_647743 [Periconia macrospinosa]|uniref:F-box domain-containing protein n=1 Tax=Periconia macrospinosa TaxID=97972 RepID=A0A2V1EF77_9PLEO|nr:hypothetical protein DM02DRAFT_647743 [Periconia macrospinosa]
MRDRKKDSADALLDAVWMQYWDNVETPKKDMKNDRIDPSLPTPPNSSNKLKRARDDDSTVEYTQHKKHRLETQRNPLVDPRRNSDTCNKVEPRRGTKRSMSSSESDAAEITEYKRQRRGGTVPPENAQASKFKPIGLHVSPLAFELNSKTVHPQYRSPLFGRLPKSIRESIYRYALAGGSSAAPNSHKNQALFSSSIAYALLRTCRAVYMETFKLPMLLTTLQFHGPGLPTTPDLNRIAPWQFALIQSLQINLEQERQSYLRSIVQKWRAKVRNESVYVVPRLFQTGEYFTTLIRSFYFGLRRPASGPLADGTRIDSTQERRSQPQLYAFGSMVARPLTHLTLRLNRDDWRYAQCNPLRKNSAEELCFDPAIFSSSTIGTWHPRSIPGNTLYTIHDMLYLDSQRRANITPEFEKDSLNSVIFSIPSLQTLDIVLETYAPKRAQLERVVECGKQWTFPITDTRERLIWTGRISEEKRRNDIDQPATACAYQSRSTQTDFDMDMDVVEERDEEGDMTTHSQQRKNSRGSTQPPQDWKSEGVIVRTLHYKRGRFQKRRTDQESSVAWLSDITEQLQETSLMDVDEESQTEDFIIDEGRDADADYRAQTGNDDDEQSRWRRGVELRRR